MAAAVGDAHLRVVPHDAAEVAGWSAERAALPATTAVQRARIDLLPLDPPPLTPPAAAAVIGRLDVRYAAQGHRDRPAASAVTRLAKGGATTPPTVELHRPHFLAATALTPADRGSATHAVLERIDFAAADTDAGVRAEVDRLRASGCITAEQADAVDVTSIVWLMSTDLGRQLRGSAAEVRREVPIYFAHGDGDGLDRTMARGRVDAVVPDGTGGWRIVDYKTDRVTGDALAARVSDYAGQMRLYTEALNRITGGRVTGATLVFLHARQMRDV